MHSVAYYWHDAASLHPQHSSQRNQVHNELSVEKIVRQRSLDGKLTSSHSCQARAQGLGIQHSRPGVDTSNPH